jgi:hypothetical protein
MAIGNILQKSDKAIVAYLVSAGAGTAQDVFPSKYSEDKDLPVTIVECKSAKMVINPGSGIWEVDFTVYVRTAGLGDEPDNALGVPADNAADRVAHNGRTKRE